MTQFATDAWSVGAIAFSAVLSHALFTPLWSQDTDVTAPVPAEATADDVTWQSRADCAPVMFAPLHRRPVVVRLNRLRAEPLVWQQLQESNIQRDGEGIERGWPEHDDRWDRKRRKRRRPHR